MSNDEVERTGRLDPFVGIHVWHATLEPGSALKMPAGHVVQPYDILLERIDEGTAKLEIATGKVVPLATGDVACALAGSPRGRLHVCTPTVRVTALLLGSMDTSRETLSTLSTFGVNVAPLMRSLKAGSRVVPGSAELTRLFREVDDSLAARDAQRCRLAVVTLLRVVASSRAQNPAMAGDRDVELATAACELMEADLSATMTIEQIAQQLDVSPSTLKRAFSRIEGTSIRAWLIDRRMQEAAELLKDTNLAVADVANAVGYANPSKFTQVFASHLGKTPSEWRKQGATR